MNAIRWANVQWHCYVEEFFPYSRELADDYERRPGLNYCQHADWVFYSEPTDSDIESLSDQVRSGAKLMRWQLQHFTDRHALQLEALLIGGLLTEPDPSQVNLAMVAYQHWQLRHQHVAKILVFHLLVNANNCGVIVNLLCDGGQRRWDYSDTTFDTFVQNCETELRFRHLNLSLPNKLCESKRKSKI